MAFAVAKKKRFQFGLILSAKLDALGWSQNRLAKATGINRQTLARWISGEFEPQWSAIVSIARAIGCTPNDFLAEEPPAEAQQ